LGVRVAPGALLKSLALQGISSREGCPSQATATGRIEGTNNRRGVLNRIAFGLTSVANFAARARLLTPGMATSP